MHLYAFQWITIYDEMLCDIDVLSNLFVVKNHAEFYNVRVTEPRTMHDNII